MPTPSTPTPTGGARDVAWEEIKVPAWQAVLVDSDDPPEGWDRPWQIVASVDERYAWFIWRDMAPEEIDGLVVRGQSESLEEAQLDAIAAWEAYKDSEPE
jgi:hypothetical protein